ncbi:MAG TPA: hypothetical protein PLG50_01410 [bacterium]|nr:hypothetical protein [bacterium]HQG44301.1 hypothetical protein [bacterium]HQI47749.1 hypothetical protein [bacterium]HQJ63868.1 hypothetical protein [bacterium]
MLRLCRHMALVLMIAAAVACAASPPFRGSLSLQSGVWKPSALDLEPSKPLQPVSGSGWSWGGSVCSPEVGGFALRFSGWHWQQEITLMDKADRVELRHLALDLKYQLLEPAAIGPYVSYGAAAVFGRETTRLPTPSDPEWSYRGYTLNIGAGIDLRLLRRWGWAAEYQYLYTNFDKNLGLTSRYSGPMLTFKLLYLF